MLDLNKAADTLEVTFVAIYFFVITSICLGGLLLFQTLNSSPCTGAKATDI